MVEQSATILGKENELQKEVYKAGKTEQALDDYMSELEGILDHRENMIRKFGESVATYRRYC